ncbi:MAG: winged helix-turn-helix transcriptional regulator [Desulfurococcales archaeon]|nr:winged helix-turn-helix transcriptional regulator [Desulfurococcales archaeon]
MTQKTHRTEYTILKHLIDHGPLSINELAEKTGYNRTWIWKKLRELEKKGLVKLSKKGRILIADYKEPVKEPQVIILGILRAAEYPYILDFHKRLQKKWNTIIKIYDDAYTLAMHLATGRVHLAMNPSVTLLLAHRISGGKVFIAGGGSGGGAGIIENPRGREGHTTTMASSMEYCAVKEHLPGPRIYARGGDEIIENVSRGITRYGVVWEPYLGLAQAKGLRTRACDLPVCCLLGIHDSMIHHVDKLKRLFAYSVEKIAKRLDSPVLIDSYSNLIGLPRDLVKRAILSYRYYPETPYDVLQNNAQLIRETLVPFDLVRRAVI